MGVSFSHSPDYLQGGVDGIVTTFAVINGAISTGVKLDIVIVLGLVNIIADGFSIACAKYLSAKAEEDLMKKTNPSYVRTPSPLSSSITTFFSFAVCGMVPLLPLIVKYYVDGNVVLRKNGITQTFGDAYFVSMYCLTLVMLATLGYLRGKIDGFDPRKTAMEVLVIGSGAALLALFVGNLFHRRR